MVLVLDLQGIPFQIAIISTITVIRQRAKTYNDLELYFLFVFRTIDGANHQFNKNQGSIKTDGLGTKFNYIRINPEFKIIRGFHPWSSQSNARDYRNLRRDNL